ncbi:MAG: MBL fold metallo-hydrolase [Ferruginibacter sp.]|nr:MBL fold metallo-hydrolase [Ferruginibacter sp.]
MALYFTSLNSGSNGNCYYVGTDTDAVLVDVGLSCRETEKRMKGLGLNMKTVKAIFVSHEHGDHIKGVSTLANKYSLPVYITKKTAGYGPRLIGHLSRSFLHKEIITIGGLEITPFVKYHDASDPHSFIISSKGITVGVFTDIGQVCKEVVHHFKQCHAVFLESNYDEDMLENGRYPIHLKNRIRGGHGHLSNKEALELFINHRSPNLSHLLLSHLSKENNSPEIAAALFQQHAGDVKITVASRYQSTEVFTISAREHNKETSMIRSFKPMQLGLFQ